MNFVIIDIHESWTISRSVQEIKLTEENNLGAILTTDDVVEAVWLGRLKGSINWALNQLCISEHLVMSTPSQFLLKSGPNSEAEKSPSRNSSVKKKWWEPA